jgi:AcrR family transcriptional regulator
MSDRRGTGTRERIQEVALELFTEQGYEKTSLREIAEHLGVTKAALYYHFKTKEDLAASFLHDYLAEIDLLVEWAAGRPSSEVARRAVLERYADLVLQSGMVRVMRFMHENQPTIRRLDMGEELKARVLAMMGAVTDEEAPLATQIRCRMAVLSVHIAYFSGQDLCGSDVERAAAARSIALELLDAAERAE